DEEDWLGEDGKPGLVDLLTCWGSGRININTASETVLQCIPDLDESAITTILAFRAGMDGELGTDDDEAFYNMEDLAVRGRITGDSAEAIKRYCTFSSTCYTITGIATLRRGKVRACCRAVVSGANVIQWREGPFDS
ncbi:MAG TPA: hypothetical protein ENN80_08155, partial [Candidatus Hydrogenedentes bacterium]|nr:hypothetical protein [Candidatus Hydrogenedentota bacterium]